MKNVALFILIVLSFTASSQTVNFAQKKIYIDSFIDKSPNDKFAIQYDLYDINSDGKLDLFETLGSYFQNDTASKFGIYLSHNYENNSFRQKKQIFKRLACNIRNFIDVNKDGKVDILLVSNSLDTLYLAIQIDTFNYDLKRIKILPHSIIWEKFADMDNDGRLDFIYQAPFPDKNMRILYQTDSLIFGHKEYTYSHFNIQELHDHGDFNGDGKQDLVSFQNNSNSSIANIYLQRDSGLFDSPIQYLFSNKSAVDFIRVVDINSDGRDDISAVYKNPTSQVFGYMLQKQTGLFDNKTINVVINQNLATQYIKLRFGDFNCDGRIEMLWYDIINYRMTIMSYNENDSFKLNNVIDYKDNLPNQNYLDTMDVDFDGRMDFVNFAREQDYSFKPIVKGFINLIRNHTFPNNVNFVKTNDVKYDTILDGFSGIHTKYNIREYYRHDTIPMNYIVYLNGKPNHVYIISDYYHDKTIIQDTCIQDTVYKAIGTICGNVLDDTIHHRTFHILKTIIIDDTSTNNKRNNYYYVPFEFGLSVSEVIHSYDFNVYPNPANQHIHIDANGEEKVEVFKMVDLMGRSYAIEKEVIDNVLRVDISKIPPGIYLLQIQVDDTISTKKIEIIK